MKRRTIKKQYARQRRLGRLMAKRCLDRRGQNILRDGWMMTHHTRVLFDKFLALYNPDRLLVTVPAYQLPVTLTAEDIQRIAAKMDKENARD